MNGGNPQDEDCIPSLKWGNWIEIMSAENHGEGWAERDKGYRLEKLSQHFEDKYGLFELAVCKPSEKAITAENIVYVKDGRILTLLERHCKYGFQKSMLISKTLREMNSINARCCYVTTKKKAIEQKIKVLQGDDYPWNKKRTRREHIKDEHVMGSWTEWKLIMVPDRTVLAPDQAHCFVRQEDGNIGYRYNNNKNISLGQHVVFELQIARGSENQVTYVEYGKLLPLLQRYCSNGYERSVINRTLGEDYSISVRYQYVSADNGKNILRQLLSLYEYAWNKSRREDTDDENIEGNWSDWVSVLTPYFQQGWTQRDDGDTSKGFHPNNFAQLFEEKYGIFEIQTGYHPRSVKSGTGGEEIGDQQDTVVYIGKGDIRTEVKKWCCNMTKQSMLIDQALKAGKCIYVRFCYTENYTFEEAADLQCQLLDRYYYTWIRPKREEVFDQNLPGKWSEWSKIMKPGEVEKDWEWRDKRCIGFKVKNLDGIFTDEYGVFELAVEKPDRDIVVHVGKGKVLSEIRKYCKMYSSFKLQVSDALAQGYSILARFMEVQSQDNATELEQNLVYIYEYPWNPFNRTKREDVDDSSLPGQHWSEWYHLMTAHVNTPDWIWRDPNHTGFRRTNKFLEKVIGKKERGVYELQIEKDRQNIVVYAGRADNLLRRLKQYCKDGSHQRRHLDDALSHSYNIWTRFRRTTNTFYAENELLDRYDYAWNISRNNKERDILRK